MTNQDDSQMNGSETIRIPTDMHKDFYRWLDEKNADVKVKAGEVFAAALIAFWEAKPSEQDRLIRAGQSYAFWIKQNGPPKALSAEQGPNHVPGSVSSGSAVTG